MKRNQIFVRAKSPSGKWGSHDVLDLDDKSFKAFVLDMLFRAGLVVGIKDEFVKEEEIEYQSTVELEEEQ